MHDPEVANPDIIRELNGVRYYLLKKDMTHQEARFYCGKRFPKGDLMEIDTKEKIEITKDLYFDNVSGNNLP